MAYILILIRNSVLCSTLHPLLDALTNGGLGVAFFAPYSYVRYFFPWQPIQVSPMGAHFFSERGLVVLISEFFWIAIPCFTILMLRFFVLPRILTQ